MPISAMLELCRGQPGFVAWVKKTAIESNEAAWLENQKPENKEKEVLKLVGANPREPTPEPKIERTAASGVEKILEQPWLPRQRRTDTDADAVAAAVGRTRCRR